MIVRAADVAESILRWGTLHYQAGKNWYRRRTATGGRPELAPTRLAGAVAGAWEHRRREWTENDFKTWRELQARCVRVADAIRTEYFALPKSVWSVVRPEDCRLLALIAWAGRRSVGCGMTLEELVQECPCGRATLVEQLKRLRAEGYTIDLPTRCEPDRNDRTIWMPTWKLQDAYRRGRRRALRFYRDMVVAPRWDRGLALLRAGRRVGAKESGARSRATWYRWRKAWIAEGYAEIRDGELVAGPRLRCEDAGRVRRAIEQRARAIQRGKASDREHRTSRRLWSLRVSPQSGATPILTSTSNDPVGRRPSPRSLEGKPARRALPRPRGLAVAVASTLGKTARPPTPEFLELKRRLEKLCQGQKDDCNSGPPSAVIG